MKKNIIKILGALFLFFVLIGINLNNDTSIQNSHTKIFFSIKKAKALVIEDELEDPNVRCACSVFGHRCKARRYGAYCGSAPCADHSDTNC